MQETTDCFLYFLTEERVLRWEKKHFGKKNCHVVVQPEKVYIYIFFPFFFPSEKQNFRKLIQIMIFLQQSD